MEMAGQRGQKKHRIQSVNREGKCPQERNMQEKECSLVICRKGSTTLQSMSELLAGAGNPRCAHEQMTSDQHIMG